MIASSQPRPYLERTSPGITPSVVVPLMMMRMMMNVPHIISTKRKHHQKSVIYARSFQQLTQSEAIYPFSDGVQCRDNQCHNQDTPSDQNQARTSRKPSSKNEGLVRLNNYDFISVSFVFDCEKRQIMFSL